MAKKKSQAQTLSIPDLRTVFSERVIAPGDTEYDKARTVVYGGIDRRPAAVIKVKNAAEVAQVISLAHEHGLELAVRSGGHSIPGHSVTEGGIVLDISNMKDVQIDLESKTAWAESGLTASEFTTATAAHGLAVGFGDAGTVGLGGITLGGGVGYLVRKHGLTIDSLLAAELVTADGKILIVDSTNYPDLFWAIRGGGGNFGVVTRFRYQLHEVDKVYGGMLFLPATAEVIASFIAAAESASEELSGIANVMFAPPMPFLAPEHHGKLIIMAMMVYAGNVADGEKAFAPFRALATPLADMLRPISYTEMYPPEQGGDYHPMAVSHNMFIDHVDRSVAETILEHLNSSTAMMSVSQLRVLGGAMARIPQDATAFAHRKSNIMVNLAALYGNPEEKSTHEAWVNKFARAIQQSDKGAYVNFLGDVDEAQVRTAYPDATWNRLREIKAQYDPTNFFHMNQNIPPK
jgi:FAD/FMN-containing dehydrogenase